MIEQGINPYGRRCEVPPIDCNGLPGNRIIAKLIPIIYRSVSLTIEMTNQEDCQRQPIIFHQQIVDAIERGDERGARSAMLAHMSENRLYIIKEIERKKKFNP